MDYLRLTIVTTVTVLTGLLGTGCSKASGSIHVSSKEHGDFTISPDQCGSGEHENFYGVDLQEGDGDKIIRIIKDPNGGYTLKTNIPGSETAITVYGEVCSTFDISLAKQSSTVNDIRGIEGHAKIDCVIDGVKLDADLLFENCF